MTSEGLQLAGFKPELKPTKMTLAEIEEKLGIDKLEII
jgi:hypothetical protein